jgi:hypothetical protein
VLGVDPSKVPTPPERAVRPFLERLFPGARVELADLR